MKLKPFSLRHLPDVRGLIVHLRHLPDVRGLIVHLRHLPDVRGIIILLSVILFGILSTTSSCRVMKQKRAALSKKVGGAKQMLGNDQKAISQISMKAGAKLVQEKIDTPTYAHIVAKLTQYGDSIIALALPLKFLDSISASKRLFRKNKDHLTSHIIKIENYTKDSLVRVHRFRLINEDLDLAQQYIFDLSAFFGPGKYKIPPDKINLAEQSFAPVIDSLVNLYKRYPDVDRFASLLVMGFADGTGFNPASETYKYLISVLKDPSAPKEALNQKLSELRSSSISDVMEVMISNRVSNFNTVKEIDFVFLETGRGEAFPSKKITDYKVNDERRRIVMLYWSVLPK